VPTCAITATPLPARAGKPFTLDLGGSRGAPGARGAVKSARVEVVDAKGAVVETVVLNTPNLSRSDVVIKKGGSHTLRAVVTDETGQTSTNSCQAPVSVVGGIPLFVGAYGGKERLFQEQPFFPDGRCAALIGAEVGIQPLIAANTEFEAAVGVKVNLRDNENTSVFGDVGVNRILGGGFLGGGLSAWDLTESDTRSVALLLQGGFNLSKDGKWQLVAQGRAPFSKMGDIESNYQFWGGFRFRPNHWK
jgi:hypothetical protein